MRKVNRKCSRPLSYFQYNLILSHQSQGRCRFFKTQASILEHCRKKQEIEAVSFALNFLYGQWCFYFWSRLTARNKALGCLPEFRYSPKQCEHSQFTKRNCWRLQNPATSWSRKIIHRCYSILVPDHQVQLTGSKQSSELRVQHWKGSTGGLLVSSGFWSCRCLHEQ